MGYLSAEKFPQTPSPLSTLNSPLLTLHSVLSALHSKTNPRPCRLTKPGLLGYNIPKRTLFSSQTLSHHNCIRMTVRESDERSSRFYTEDVQQDYCTYEELKCLFPHSRHLLPAADCGKGKRVWTLCELVRFDDSIYSRKLSISRLLGRFLHFMTWKKTDTCVRLLQQK